MRQHALIWSIREPLMKSRNTAASDRKARYLLLMFGCSVRLRSSGSINTTAVQLPSASAAHQTHPLRKASTEIRGRTGVGSFQRECNANRGGMIRLRLFGRGGVFFR